MNVFHQERFIGPGHGSPYFEGWYYRMVSPEGRSVSIIPGISVCKDKSHSFVQIIESNGLSIYKKYPLSAFGYSKDSFYVNIGDNIFTREGLKLNINGENNIFGKVKFENRVEYNKSVVKPGIMGPFSFIPMMECRHDVICVKSRLSGEINIDDEKISMFGGKGYIEKDRGVSFPSEYLWIQSNDFFKTDASFMLAAATVPIMGRKIKGLISYLWIDGGFYNFTTYGGAYVKQMSYCGDMLKVNIKSLRYSLNVELSQNSISMLKAPSDGVMERPIMESCQSNLKIELHNRNGIVFNDTAKCAAAEIFGNIAANY